MLLGLVAVVGWAAMRRRCLLKEKSFYLWILVGKVISRCALSVPWLSSASLFNDLRTSPYFSCDDSSYSRGFGGLVIFLTNFQSEVYFFWGARGLPLEVFAASLLCFTFPSTYFNLIPEAGSPLLRVQSALWQRVTWT